MVAMVNTYLCLPIYKLVVDSTIDNIVDTIKKRVSHHITCVMQDLKATSKHGIVSVFHYFPFGINPMGMYDSLPLEMRYTWLLGLMEFMLEA
jgi:hypothetical protein